MTRLGPLLPDLKERSYITYLISSHPISFHLYRVRCEAIQFDISGHRLQFLLYDTFLHNIQQHAAIDYGMHMHVNRLSHLPAAENSLQCVYPCSRIVKIG